jgi:hypothetical protein
MDCENFEDFNRQRGNVEYIAIYVMPLLGMHPSYLPISNVDLTSLPYADILNHLETNITEIGRVLSLAYPSAQLGIQPVRISGTFVAGQQVIALPRRIPLIGDWRNGKTWTDGGPAPDYTDVNRWENNLSIVYEWAKQQPKITNGRPSGTFVSGQSIFLPRMVI